MSLWSRIANVFRGRSVSREIDDEFQTHIEEAIQHGRSDAEARRAFGSIVRKREESRDIRLLPWLDSLRADTVFGWRQLRKNKVTSAAAILSLALAIGACTSAFRLIDALLLRPLPIANPERLYVLVRQGIGPSGEFRTSEGSEYPLFRQMRAAVKDQADLIAVSYADRTDLTYGSDPEMEKAWRQYVSGSMFSSFGLRSAAGRLFTENDDVTPGAHPYAVLSYDYWRRRFGNDADVIGHNFQIGNTLYQIIGVAPEHFTGTETGTVTDIFIPTMMHPRVRDANSSWFRTFACMKPGVAVGPIRERLNAMFRASQQEMAKELTGWPKQRLERFLQGTLTIEPAPVGVSGMQKEYRVSLAALGVLVALVLLIACANVANLMTAQAAARAREMALRVSIGAGRSRLIQLVLVESTLLAFLAAAIGWMFAWWSAPFVVSLINPPDNPARLFLPADGTVLGFALVLTLGVTFLFGLAPAIRASAVQPASALKGGDDPHSRRRTMHALIAAQVAFCFVVLFVAALFIASFDRLSNQSTGFSAERLLTLDTVAQPAQSIVFWEQMAEHLRAMPGIEKVALAGWPLLSGNGQNGFVAVSGNPPGQVLNYFLNVSRGWFDTMKIPLIAGRDFRPGDTYPGVAVVNKAFAKEYFNGENPVGKSFERTRKTDGHFDIVGLARDARYRNMREPITPTVYLPIRYAAASEVLNNATFLVRTSGPNPLAIAPMLRHEIARTRSEFRVSNIRTQTEINKSGTVRERLLAMLALFFAAVALLLAGVGLYGVLDYSVLQRRREIGIRMAIGAQAGDIAWRVTAEVFSMVLVGALAGLGLGLGAVRYIETLLYQVKAGDIGMLAVPSLTIIAAALLAALPPVIRAVRIDPVKTLRIDA